MTSGEEGLVNEFPTPESLWNMTFSDHIVALQKQKGKTLLPELIIEMVDWARNLQLKMSQ